MTEDLLCVSSAQLDKSAEVIRKRKSGPMTIPALGIEVSAAQLDTAAQILRDAEPSVCNWDVQERPGFIHADRQDDPNVLVFDVGILPSTAYRIDRKGHAKAQEE
jgi:hypothetical protein